MQLQLDPNDIIDAHDELKRIASIIGTVPFVQLVQRVTREINPGTYYVAIRDDSGPAAHESSGGSDG